MRDYKLFDDVYKHIWLRTEKGGLDAELEPFLNAGVMEFFAALSNDRLTKGEAFSVSAAVLERRTLKKSSTFAHLVYRTRLTITKLNADASFEVFIEVAFRRYDPRPSNPSGWRLSDAIRTTPEVFYKEEHDALANEYLKTTTSQPPQSSDTSKRATPASQNGK
jgi:hypothetical protein